MTLNKKHPKPIAQKETLREYEYRLRQEAKELAKQHQNIKVTKFLLK
jgi:hypothetical protein